MMRLLAAFLGLCIALPAAAQSIATIWGTSPTSYLLDGQSAPTAAFSLRRLLTSYTTNKLINVVRASDSTTTDIGFDATGALDLATLNTFCNATTCKVVTWYDQSGNTRNITQATDGNRPVLVFNCLGIWPCLQTTTTQFLNAAVNITPATGIVSFNAVGNRVTGTGNCTWMRENGNVNRFIARNAVANNWAVSGGTSGLINGPTATDGVFHTGTGVITNDATSVVNIDGVDGTPGTVVGNTAAGAMGITGVASTTCDYLSAAFWDNIILSSTARTMLAANQRAWWGF